MLLIFHYYYSLFAPLFLPHYQCLLHSNFLNLSRPRVSITIADFLPLSHSPILFLYPPLSLSHLLHFLNPLSLNPLFLGHSSDFLILNPFLLSSLCIFSTSFYSKWDVSWTFLLHCFLGIVLLQSSPSLSHSSFDSVYMS